MPIGKIKEKISPTRSDSEKFIETVLTTKELAVADESITDTVFVVSIDLLVEFARQLQDAKTVADIIAVRTLIHDFKTEVRDDPARSKETKEYLLERATQLMAITNVKEASFEKLKKLTKRAGRRNVVQHAGRLIQGAGVATAAISPGLGLALGAVGTGIAGIGSGLQSIRKHKANRLDKKAGVSETGSRRTSSGGGDSQAAISLLIPLLESLNNKATTTNEFLHRIANHFNRQARGKQSERLASIEKRRENLRKKTTEKHVELSDEHKTRQRTFAQDVISNRLANRTGIRSLLLGGGGAIVGSQLAGNRTDSRGRRLLGDNKIVGNGPRGKTDSGKEKGMFSNMLRAVLTGGLIISLFGLVAKSIVGASVIALAALGTNWLLETLGLPHFDADTFNEKRELMGKAIAATVAVVVAKKVWNLLRKNLSLSSPDASNKPKPRGRGPRKQLGLKLDKPSLASRAWTGIKGLAGRAGSAAGGSLGGLLLKFGGLLARIATGIAAIASGIGLLPAIAGALVAAGMTYAGLKAYKHYNNLQNHGDTPLSNAIPDFIMTPVKRHQAPLVLQSSANNAVSQTTNQNNVGNTTNINTVAPRQSTADMILQREMDALLGM